MVVFALSCDVQDAGQFTATTGTVSMTTTEQLAGLGSVQVASGGSAQVSILQVDAQTTPTLRFVVGNASASNTEAVIYLRTTGVGNEDLRLRVLGAIAGQSLLLERADGLGGWTSVTSTGPALTLTSDLLVVELGVSITDDLFSIRWWRWRNGEFDDVNLTGTQGVHGASGNRNRFDLACEVAGNIRFSQIMLADDYAESLGPDYFVRTRFPIADQTATGWTISSGSNRYAVLDENPPNTTDFISRTSVGSAFHDGTTRNATLIITPTAYVHARSNANGGVITSQPTIEPGDCTIQGDLTLTTTYQTYRGVANVNLGFEAKIGVEIKNAGTRLTGGPPTTEISTCWVEAVYRAAWSGSDLGDGTETRRDRSVTGEQEAAAAERATRDELGLDASAAGNVAFPLRAVVEPAAGIEDSRERDAVSLERADGVELAALDRPGYDAAAAAEVARPQRDLRDLAEDGIELAVRDVAGEEELAALERVDLTRPGHDTSSGIEIARRDLPSLDAADAAELAGLIARQGSDPAAGSDSDDRTVTTTDPAAGLERSDRAASSAESATGVDRVHRGVTGADAPAIGSDQADRAVQVVEPATGAELANQLTRTSREAAEGREAAVHAVLGQDSAATLEPITRRQVAGEDETTGTERADATRAARDPLSGQETSRREATSREPASSVEAAQRAAANLESAAGVEAGQRAAPGQDAAIAAERIDVERRLEDELLGDDTSRRRILADIDELTLVETGRREVATPDAAFGGEQVRDAARPARDVADGLDDARARDATAGDHGAGLEDAPARELRAGDPSLGIERAAPLRPGDDASAGGELARPVRNPGDASQGDEHDPERELRIRQTADGRENAHRPDPRDGDIAIGDELAKPDRREPDEALGNEDLAVKEADIAREIRFNDGEGGHSEVEAGSVSYDPETGSAGSDVETSTVSFEPESGSASFEAG